MANTFKVVTFAAEPASAGTPYKMYTVAGSTTTVVLGLILTNIHSSAVTVEVELVSDTGSRGGANNVTNGTSFLVKDVSIPSGSSLELLSGGKVVLAPSKMFNSAGVDEIAVVVATDKTGIYPP